MCKGVCKSIAFLPSRPEKYIQSSHSKVRIFTSSTPSPIDLLVIIPSHVSKAVDSTPLSLRGPCKVITSHISIVIIIVIAIPLRSFALSLAFWIRLPNGTGAADGLRTLAGCWRLEVIIRCRSWDSGGSSKVRSFMRVVGTFESVAHTLIVFEFFGAVGKRILAKHRDICFEREVSLPYTTNQLLVCSKKVLFSNHNSNVLVCSQMIEEVSRSDRSTRHYSDFRIDS